MIVKKSIILDVLKSDPNSLLNKDLSYNDFIDQVYDILVKKSNSDSIVKTKKQIKVSSKNTKIYKDLFQKIKGLKLTTIENRNRSHKISLSTVSNVTIIVSYTSCKSNYNTYTVRVFNRFRNCIVFKYHSQQDLIKWVSTYLNSI